MFLGVALQGNDRLEQHAERRLVERVANDIGNVRAAARAFIARADHDTATAGRTRGEQRLLGLRPGHRLR